MRTVVPPSACRRAAGMSPYAEQLADAVDLALPGWVRRVVAARLDGAGTVATPALDAATDHAAAAAAAFVHAELRSFLELDVDEQRTNPLAVLRAAVRFPTEVLASAGVPPVRRDEFEVRAFPADVYGLSPATWRDVDESLHEPGILWGAWKASTVLARRRAEGRR